jgi:hypothetical protein
MKAASEQAKPIEGVKHEKLRMKKKSSFYRSGSFKHQGEIDKSPREGEDGEDPMKDYFNHNSPPKDDVVRNVNVNMVKRNTSNFGHDEEDTSPLYKPQPSGGDSQLKINIIDTSANHQKPHSSALFSI